MLTSEWFKAGVVAAVTMLGGVAPRRLLPPARLAMLPAWLRCSLGSCSPFLGRWRGSR